MRKQVFWVAVVLCLPLSLARVVHGGISPLQSFSHVRRVPSDPVMQCIGADTGKAGYCYAADDLHTVHTVPEPSGDCTANATCWVPIQEELSADFRTSMREDGRADIRIIGMKQVLGKTGEVRTSFTIEASQMDTIASEIKLINYNPIHVEKVSVNFTGKEIDIEFDYDVLSSENGTPSSNSKNSTVVWIELSAFDDPLSLQPIAEGHFEFTAIDIEFSADWVGEEGTDTTPCLRVAPGTKDVIITDVGTCPSTSDVCYFLENADMFTVSECTDVDNIATQQPDEPNAQVTACLLDYPEQYIATSGDIILELDGTNLAVTAIFEEGSQPDSLEVIAYDPHDPSRIFTQPQDFACHKITSNMPGESECSQKINLPGEQKLMNVLVVALDQDGYVMHSHITTVNVLYEHEVEQDQGAVIAAGTLGAILALVILLLIVKKIRKR